MMDAGLHMRRYGSRGRILECANQKIKNENMITLTSKWSGWDERIAVVPKMAANSVQYRHAVSSFFFVRALTDEKMALLTTASQESSKVASVGRRAEAEVSLSMTLRKCRAAMDASAEMVSGCRSTADDETVPGGGGGNAPRCDMAAVATGCCRNNGEGGEQHPGGVRTAGC